MDAYELPISVPLGPWRERALCAELCRAGEARTEWWHPERGGTAAQAIAICKRCPVMGDCRDHAVTAGERHGVWGGTGPTGRRTPRDETKVRVIVCRQCTVQFTHVGYGNRLLCEKCRENRGLESRRLARAAWRAKQREVA